jgi:hypothetical protein
VLGSLHNKERLMKYTKINYEDLNSKQKEKYNYQKVSSVLAEYGFITLLLSDDWNNADFLAVHKDGDVLKVQLKGRMTFDKKYEGKDLHICFPFNGNWYLYPHDELLLQLANTANIKNTDSWSSEGKYSFPTLSAQNEQILRPFKIN